MIERQELWKELIRLLSVECHPTKAVLAETCMGAFFIPSVSDTVFAMLFLSKPPADYRWTEDHSFRNTGPKHAAHVTLFHLVIVWRIFQKSTQRSPEVLGFSESPASFTW
jgi:hypothetical protein